VESAFDNTGRQAYLRACKKFSTKASSSVQRQLSNPKTKAVDISYYNIGPKGAKALIVPLLVVKHLLFKHNSLHLFQLFSNYFCYCVYLGNLFRC
jgi:hypothetical protein